MSLLQISFKGNMWRSKGKGGWYFLIVPTLISNKIRKNHKNSEEGWGRLKVQVSLGKTQWKTSLWFDTKLNSYLLPLNAKVRKIEEVRMNEEIKVHLKFDRN